MGMIILKIDLSRRLALFRKILLLRIRILKLHLILQSQSLKVHLSALKLLVLDDTRNRKVKPKLKQRENLKRKSLKKFSYHIIENWLAINYMKKKFLMSRQSERNSIFLTQSIPRYLLFTLIDGKPWGNKWTITGISGNFWKFLEIHFFPHNLG